MKIVLIVVGVVLLAVGGFFGMRWNKGRSKVADAEGVRSSVPAEAPADCPGFSRDGIAGIRSENGGDSYKTQQAIYARSRSGSSKECERRWGDLAEAESNLDAYGPYVKPLLATSAGGGAVGLLLVVVGLTRKRR